MVLKVNHRKIQDAHAECSSCDDLKDDLATQIAKEEE